MSPPGRKANPDLAAGRLHTAVIDTAAEGVCIGHPLEEFPGLIYFLEQGMTAITGCTRDEINRQGWIQTLHADASDQDLARLHELTRGRNPGRRWANTRPDRVRRVVSLSTSRLEEPAGVNSIVFLLEDVTERRKLALAGKGRAALHTALRAARMISWDWTAQNNEIQFSADVDAFLAPPSLVGRAPFPLPRPRLLVALHDRDRLQEKFQLSRTATGEFSVQWQGVAPNGNGSPRWSPRWVNSSAARPMVGSNACAA